MDLKKLLEQMRALTAEIESALAEEDGATDEAGKSAARAKYEAKSKEFETLELKVSKAKAHAKRMSVVTEVETLAAPSGNVIPLLGKTPAQAIDHDKEEAKRVDVFTDFICGKAISDVAMDSFAPTSKGWDKGKTGFAIPKSLARVLLPETRILGKALPLTSVQASPANLFQAELQKQLNMFPGEAASLFPRTFKIPTKSGSVIFPELSQGAPGAEGGADEFAEYGSVACAWTAEGAEKEGTEPVFTQRSMATYELAAKTELSRTLLNRSIIDMEALLGQLFRAAMLHKIDLAIIKGNGVGKPEGILQKVGVAAPARTTGATVKYADLVNLEYAIAPQFRAGANWIVADGAAKALELLVDGNQRPLFATQNDSLSTGPKLGKIKGYTAIPTQRTTLGAAGDLIFGEIGQYACPVEQEIVMLRSEHEKMSKGVIVFVIFAQIGGKVMQNRAFSKLPA